MKRTFPLADRFGSALVLSVLLAVNAAAQVPARPATTVGPIRISVPDGFVAAQTQRQKKMLVTAWTKSVRGDALKTLLQINIVDFGPVSVKPPVQPDATVAADRYLRQFLSGVEHRRSDFRVSPIAHLQLAGLPASRATWNGSLAGRATVGVMYSVIVRNRYAVILHTQDLGSTPSNGMFEAMQSIEGLTVPD